jgi:LysM repeat protein
MPSAEQGVAEQQYGLGLAREFNGASDSGSFAQAFRNEATLQTYGQFNADWRNVQQYAFQNSNLSALGFPDGANFSLSGVETPQSGAQYLDFTNTATGQTVAVDQLGDVYNQQTGALEMPSPFVSQSVADAVPQNYETATDQDLSNLQSVLQADAGQEPPPPPPETPPTNDSGQQSCPANGELPNTPQDSGQQGCPDDSGQQANPDDSGQQANPDNSGQQANPDDSGQQANPDDSGQQGDNSNSPNLPGLSPNGAPAPAPPDSSPAPTAQESDVHQVAAGETLWSIAQHDLGGDPSQTDIAQRVQQLATENKISDPNKIYVGQTINLDSASTEAAQIPAPIVAPIPTSPVAPAAAPAAKQK